MDECVFCKIISGDLPSHKIYEDEHVMAFLDIRPVTKGHTVVITKTHIEQVWDMNSDDYARLMNATRQLAKHLRLSLDAFRVGLLIEGLEVPHAHGNLVPLETGIKKSLNTQTIGEPDHGALEALANKLHIDTLDQTA